MASTMYRYISLARSHPFPYFPIWHAYRALVQILRDNIRSNPLIINPVSTPLRMFTDCPRAIALVVTLWALFRGQGEAAKSALKGRSGREHWNVGSSLFLFGTAEGRRKAAIEFDKDD